jgi:DNA-directed RNA polymerase specialized sigma24 family protein
VVCSAFAAAWQEAPQRTPRRATPYARLIALTHREAVAVARRARAGRSSEAPWPGPLPVGGGGGARAALEGLADREREVIDRCYLDGYLDSELGTVPDRALQ